MERRLAAILAADAHDVERDLCAAIAKEMQAHEAPRELYGRFGLENFC